MLVMLTILLATAGVYAVPAEAAFHYEDVGGSFFALWNSCPQVAVGSTCAFTLVEAFKVRTNDDFTTERNCVDLFQARGAKLDDFTIRSFDTASADACGLADVVVPASLTLGRVRGTIPVRDCHFDLATATETCTPPTALDVSLDLEGTGDVARSPSRTYRYSYEPGQRCLVHYNPDRSREANASGRIDGLPAPLGGLQEATLFFGGTVTIGTDQGCYD
jgi:hypothetical protein